MRSIGLFVILLSLFMADRGMGAIVDFRFQGNGGLGLRPDNEVPPVTSTATGDESGLGLVYNDATNVLSVNFSFSGLTGGLADAADGGIHIHDAGPTNPQGMNGGIEFNLNAGAANVALGSTAGTISTNLTLTDAQEIELLNGQYYVNVHSQAFGTGELRGNLSAVPEPSGALLCMGLLSGLAFRRRRQ